jgi:hypothetical protein
MRPVIGSLFVAACLAVSVASQAEIRNVDPEIRKALCQIRNKDYTGAQKTIDGVLLSDPQNLYARRLVPGIVSYQIRKNDRSPQNIAMIRRAIDAFRTFSKGGVSIDDQERSDYEIVSLAGLIDDENDSPELLAIGNNSEFSPLARSQSYISLAARSNTCANDLISQKPRPTRAAIDAAKGCIKKGLEYTETALSLRPDSDSGWSYRASLLSNSSKLAILERDPTRAATLKKESSVAVEKFRELSRRERQAEEDAKIPTPETKPDTETLAVEFAKDLERYRSEKPLAKLIDSVLTNYQLMAPDIPATKPEISPRSIKREWHLFSPPGEAITAMLPSDASSIGSSSFQASSDGVTYLITSVPRLSSQVDELTNIALNNLTWGTVLGMRNLMLMGDSPATYEVTHLRNEGLGGYPGKTYSVTLDMCSGKESSVLIVVVTTARNYAIQVIGAAQDDPRAVRFLRSIRFK